MRKNKRENYDVNNSMENYSNEEKDKKNKKLKKHEKKGKKKVSENILEEIKKEDLNERDEILKEINNTMMKDNDDDKKRDDKSKKESENQKSENKKKEEDENKAIKEKKEKEKVKNKKKKNNLSETINEINNELNDQYYLDVENIFEINKKFNYPKNSPFLYIREDNTENDLFPNPLSTMEIKNLLKSKTIKPFLVKVKPIDIFTMKNYPEFSYFDFNEILTKNWSKNLEYSSIFLEEYKNFNDYNNIKNLEDKAKNLKISKEHFEYQANEKKKKNKIDYKIDRKIDKNNDITLDLNFSISQIDKTGFNDLSMSIIKQLQNVKLTKKQVNKITSIIEEVEEDEWTEVKNKKKEKESVPFIGIVGLNESKQVIETKTSQNNKKSKNRKNKNKKFVNMSNNQFAGLKINYSSSDEENINY